MIDKNRMRIIHINNIASVGEILTNQLKKLGYDARLREPPIPLLGYPTFIKSLNFFYRQKFALNVLKELKDPSSSILHIHYAPSAAFFLFSKCPLVLHAHGSDVRVSKWNFVRRALNWVLFTKASHIIYSTPDLKPYFTGFADKTTFLPNPIENTFCSEASKNLSDISKKIFLFSSLTSIKGADKSLEALEIFKQRHPEAEITILKHGPMFQEKYNLIFHVAPIQHRENLPRMIKEHGIILGQFHLGAIGMSELEAMICERPVIAYFRYNLAYPEPSPILTAHSAEDIVKQIETLYGNAALISRTGQASQKWAHQYHDAGMVCQKLISIYNSLIHD